MSQKLPVDGFKWIKTSLVDKKFNKFIKVTKHYAEEGDERYILVVDNECPKNRLICIVISYFYQKE